QLDPPRQTSFRAGNRQIAQGLGFEKAEHLIEPRRGTDESGNRIRKALTSLQVLNEVFLVPAHPEKIIAFAQPFDRTFAVRTKPVHDILFGPEPLDRKST